MPPRRPLAFALVAIVVGLLAGCGNSRAPAPDLSTIQAPKGTLVERYDGYGLLRFDAPANWSMLPGAPPLVVTISSGPAVIAIWHYPRSTGQALPSDAAALRQARAALIGAARARDPTLRVIASTVIDVPGPPPVRGVELDALETIRGQARRVRSTHLYEHGAELVIDEYAPVPLFHAVDRTVFSPLLHSVRLVRVRGG